MRRINFIKTQEIHKKKRYDEYDYQQQRILFSEKEIKRIQQRFSKQSQSGFQTYKQFKESLGIMGLGDTEFLSQRLFQVIDVNNSNKILFEDFLNYLNILINGNILKKAEMSFKFLDVENKGRILQKDIEQLCQDVLMFWHSITGSTILPNLKKVQMLVKALGLENTGEISFSTYLETFESISDLIDWYEFFNENVLDIQQNNNKQIDVGKLNQAIGILQDELLDYMIQVRSPKKQIFNELSPNFNVNLSYINNSDQQIEGPLYCCIQTPKKIGDVDPSQECHIQSHQLYQPHFSLFLDQEQYNKSASQAKYDKLLRLEKKHSKRPQSLEVRRATVANIAKKHKAIYFGHENWNLIVSMMIGMRASVQFLCPLSIELREQDFQNKYIHYIKNDQSISYQFIDYAGIVFERIRLVFNITKKQYSNSIGPENLLGNLMLGKLTSLSELSSSGKSGSFFYFTDDGNYMIKTISKNEFKLMKKIIKSYYQYIKDYNDTKLSRILGLHQLRVFKNKERISKTYIIVIVNLFQSPLSIDIRYDLKGSTFGRKTRKQNKMIDKNIALKDLDFLNDNVSINLQKEYSQSLLKSLKNDVLFLESCSIIDYSLLIGIHWCKYDYGDHNFIQSQDKKHIYFIGIIDILTKYNTPKQLEYNFKHTFVDNNISCVPPKEYATRFFNFIKTQVFK